jgi:hypothetical protein
VNGKIVGPFPDAFKLRPPGPTRGQETYLSAIYYEFFSGAHTVRIKRCCAALSYTPLPSDGLLYINAGLIKQQGKKLGHNVRAVHRGSAQSPAYAGIQGIPIQTDDKLNSLLAKLAVVETIEVRSIV